MSMYLVVIFLVAQPEVKLLSVWQAPYLYFRYDGIEELKILTPLDRDDLEIIDTVVYVCYNVRLAVSIFVHLV